MSEKALAKVKGSYAALAAGFNQTGLALWTGVPVVSYKGTDVTSNSLALTVWNNVKAGMDAGYVMTSGSAGSGNDQVQNSCGIAMSHAYTILGAF